MIHSFAHIESYAIDLSWDIIHRYSRQGNHGVEMPNEFFGDWIKVAADEARHFCIWADRLLELGSSYGSEAVHDGLWFSAMDSKNSLLERLAVVHMVHEARGLDVTPRSISRLRAGGDAKSAELLHEIYLDEITHVAAGVKWFRYLCSALNLDPIPTFHDIVCRRFSGNLKPPFNDYGRAKAGFTKEWYLPLANKAQKNARSKRQSAHGEAKAKHSSAALLGTNGENRGSAAQGAVQGKGRGVDASPTGSLAPALHDAVRAGLGKAVGAGRRLCTFAGDLMIFLEPYQRHKFQDSNLIQHHLQEYISGLQAHAQTLQSIAETLQRQATEAKGRLALEAHDLSGGEGCGGRASGPSPDVDDSKAIAQEATAEKATERIRNESKALSSTPGNLERVVSDAPCSADEKQQFDKVLAAQKVTVSDFWREKYEAEASKYWNMFYKRHSDRFFKDRHYLNAEMGQEIKSILEQKAQADASAAGMATFLEVGCGVGNAMFPLLREHPQLRVCGVDIAAHAIEIIQKQAEFKEAKSKGRCDVWACDIVNQPLPTGLGQVDIASFIFVLSAIHPDKLVSALRKIHGAMAKGGVLFIRDYAVYDLSQLRFKNGAKIGEHFYVRGDGTRTYYFSIDSMRTVLRLAGFRVETIKYHRKTVQNVKRQLSMKRRWIQALARRI